ncbi:MAG: hypothetical protein JW700_00915 [Candidatus Aenigmarchaeota archaeon]|nr:hypothetical protein [Candidatus Aenigmarchaeota archaeon]
MIEHRDISEFLKKCYNGVVATSRYYHKESASVFSNPYLVPTDCLSYLKKSGCKIFVDVAGGLVKINYGEGNRKQVCHRLCGTFDGIMNGDNVSGLMLASQTDPSNKEHPRINNAAKAMRVMEIIDEIKEMKIETNNLDYMLQRCI